MGIAPTGAIYKTLTFDSANSGTYGVYITGEAVYNAPERDVEMIEIPGRNGAFALDRGRFQNIEVSYPAGIFADDETDFAQAISDFRNLLCSKKGYCKLTDDYNDGEYRMAVYKSGLEVTPAQLRAGEFEIVFECKPQRFLVSGEDKITVTSGDDVNNPTLFDAKPLIEATGYGTMNINNDTIVFDGQDIGEIIVASGGSGTSAWNSTNSTKTITVNFDDTFLNTGDNFDISLKNQAAVKTTAGGNTNIQYYNTATLTPTFVYGTAASTNTNAGSTVIAYITAAYNGAHTITLTFRATMSAISGKTVCGIYNYSETFAYSTVPSDNSMVTVDLDIGEAWTEVGGSVVSLNDRVSMPAELPVLAPGNTTITYDNTFTKIEIIPRYWIV